MSCADIVVIRAAASSMARGMPSSRRQISSTAARAASSSGAAGTGAVEEEGDGLGLLDALAGQRQRAEREEPLAARGQRLPAGRQHGRVRRFDAMASTSSATAPSRCSQLSRISSVSRSASQARTAARLADPTWALMPKGGRDELVDLVRGVEAPELDERRPVARVVQMPRLQREAGLADAPTPMIVTSEELLSAVRRSASSRRRPTNDDGSQGRLPAERALGGGKCRASPSAASWAMRTPLGLSRHPVPSDRDDLDRRWAPGRPWRTTRGSGLRGRDRRGSTPARTPRRGTCPAGRWRPRCGAPCRPRRAALPGHSVVVRERCAATAVSTASSTRLNTAATRSPDAERSCPPLRATSSRTTDSWMVRQACASSGWASQASV